MFTDCNSPEHIPIQENLVREDFLPATFEPLLDIDNEHALNLPISYNEFQNALHSSNLKSAPGLDSITCFYLSDTLRNGFRRGRSFSDVVASFVAEIYCAMNQKGHFEAFALDIKVAFNAIKPIKILEELVHLNTPGHLVNFVRFLILKRYLYFNLNKNESRTCGIGVPQGSVLSPLLFSLPLTNIISCLPNDVFIVMYADDILLYAIGKDLHETNSLLQEALKNIQDWLLFSIPKTEFAIFTKQTKINREVHWLDFNEHRLMSV